MRRLGLGLALLAAAIAVAGALLATGRVRQQDVAARPDLALAAAVDAAQYARVLTPRDWTFPADFGPHPEFQTEWWYYTGNLATETGQRFGYQFTIFRRAIAPEEPASDSEWRSNQMYAAHFTVTDVSDGQFYEAQRLSRPGAGLAGVTVEPRYSAWLEDWSVAALDDDVARVNLVAADEGVGVDLVLERTKPPALQGDAGLSAKGDRPGEASYYYSLTRLDTHGTVTVAGVPFDVGGTSWMDQEFTSGALSRDPEGWDWFGLHLEDGRDLMLAQIRSIEPGAPPLYHLGALVEVDGTVRALEVGDFSIDVTANWTSPYSGVRYPAGWVLRLTAPAPLELRLTPLLADQELVAGDVIYWEGAVRIEGDTTGYGYAELTGYASAMRGRF